MMTRQVTVMYICTLLHYHLGIAYIARQIDTTSIRPFTARVHPVLGSSLLLHEINKIHLATTPSL